MQALENLSKALDINIYIVNTQNHKVTNSFLQFPYKLQNITDIINQSLSSDYCLMNLQNSYCITDHINNDNVVIIIPNCGIEQIDYATFNINDSIASIESLCHVIDKLFPNNQNDLKKEKHLNIQNIPHIVKHHSNNENVDQQTIKHLLINNNLLIDSMVNINRTSFEKIIDDIIDSIELLTDITNHDYKIILVEYISALNNVLVSYNYPLEKSLTIKKKLYSEIENVNSINFKTYLRKICLIYFNSMENYHNQYSISLAKQIQLYIDANINYKITLNDIANDLNISLKRLNPTFKKQFGMTINRYIRLQKISISKKLLKTTNLSLQDIADQLGFTTKSYFIHTFSVFTGKTPLKYREDSIFS